MSSFDILVPLGVTSAIAYSLSRKFTRAFPKLGIFGEDIHKPERPVRAEMGGVAILIAAFGGGVAALLLQDPLSPLFVAGLSTVLLAGCVGAVDDVRGIRQSYKPLLIAGASIPLAIALSSRTGIEFPLIGHLTFGVFYPLFVVPFAVATSANFSNILAGFNGLEAGISGIAIGTLTALSGIRGNADSVVLGLLLLAALVAFLKFNWFPAKIFPGDSGTLFFGAAIASIGLMGGLEAAAITLSMPAALDFALKSLSRRPFGQRLKYGDTTINARGHLTPPNYPALAHAFLKTSNLSERGLVISLLATELVYSFVAVTVTLLLM